MEKRDGGPYLDDVVEQRRKDFSAKSEGLKEWQDATPDAPVGDELDDLEKKADK